MFKSGTIVSGAVALGITFTAPAQAQNAREFPLRIGNMHTTVQCERLSSSGALTADFLGALDSGFHAAQGKNLYTISASERRPYLEEALNANPSFNSSFVRQVFERPYKQYAALPDEQSRIRFLKNKLRGHGFTDSHLDGVVAACES